MQTTNRKLSKALIVLCAGIMVPAAAFSAMTPQQCYKRDSQCTRFCDGANGADWRHECFMRCNIYLNNCLDRGVWTDKAKAVLTPDGGGGGPKSTRSPIGKIAPLSKSE